MKNLGLLRRELGVRTAFNIVYPLVNPARAQYQMVGVFHEKLLDLVALCLYKSGTRRALVFHGHGLDELSCIGPAKSLEVTPEGINSFTLDPEAYGLPLCKKEDLKGGSIEENAHILRDIFSGTTSAKSDTLIFNAGVAIYLYGKTASIEEGIALAKKRLEEGAPDELLKQWRMR
jgi:anthranilate phosphoribosyltransferase